MSGSHGIAHGIQSRVVATVIVKRRVCLAPGQDRSAFKGRARLGRCGSVQHVDDPADKGGRWGQGEGGSNPIHGASGHSSSTVFETGPD